MGRQEKVLEKNRRGRPAIGKGVQLNAMIRPEQAAALDAWIAIQPDPKPSRPEAIRRLLEVGLKSQALPDRPSTADLEDRIASVQAMFDPPVSKRPTSGRGGAVLEKAPPAVKNGKKVQR
jgi:hypothetical protein